VSELVLEVIACSVADAIEARDGGANRLEVVSDLEQGGLTPSFELVSAIKEKVNLPLRVILRDSVGYAVHGDDEIETVSAAAEQFAKLGVDGLVVGFLKGDRVDIELTERVVARAPGLRITFHHAFEDAGNQVQALRDIKSMVRVDKILSSGGSGNLPQRCERLARYAQAAAPEISIIAGGGIDGEVISMLKRTTTIREFHVGRAARSGFRVDGDVQAELVNKLLRVVRES